MSDDQKKRAFPSKSRYSGSEDLRVLVLVALKRRAFLVYFLLIHCESSQTTLPGGRFLRASRPQSFSDKC